MAEKVAFITGINGQDGSYLAELLIKKNYYVYGIIRRMSCINTIRIDHLYSNPKFKVYYGDLTDALSLKNTIDTILKKHIDLNVFEVYNLAAQSHVKVSFELPEYTMQVNAVGTLNLLEVLRNTGQIDKIRFYQAGTSEMYGDQKHNLLPLNEETLFNPVSPYAISKLAAYQFVKMYRDGYNMFACNGILFNHESPRRGENFVTRKIIIGVSQIVTSKQEFIELGNLDAIRDWGHAKDYVEAMWRMLQLQQPEDFVIGTGKCYTVRAFVEKVFAYYGKTIYWEGSGMNEVGKDHDTGRILIKLNERLFRPIEVPYLQADFRKAVNILGWQPTFNIDLLISDMIAHER
jgi:GDPmannose 4,6-dehydratase